MKVNKSAVQQGTIGTGTTNTIAKYTAANTLGNSSVTDNGTIITSTEPIVFSGHANPPATDSYINGDVAKDIQINAVAGQVIDLYIGGTVPLEYTGTNFDLAFGLTLAGLGFPAIVAAPAPTARGTAATNWIDYTPAAISGTMYEMDIGILVNTNTTDSFSCIVTYTAPIGTQTLTVGGFSPAGAALTTGLITNAVGVGLYTFPPVMISPDNSGTAITFSTAGTFTTVNYTIITVLKRLL